MVRSDDAFLNKIFKQLSAIKGTSPHLSIHFSFLISLSGLIDLSWLHFAFRSLFFLAGSTEETQGTLQPQGSSFLVPVSSLLTESQHLLEELKATKGAVLQLEAQIDSTLRDMSVSPPLSSLLSPSLLSLSPFPSLPFPGLTIMPPNPGPARMT